MASFWELQHLIPLTAQLLHPAWTLPWTVISCPSPLPVSLGGPVLCTAWTVSSAGSIQGRSLARIAPARLCAAQARIPAHTRPAVLGKSPSLSPLLCQITKLALEAANRLQ